jgi:crossover junction endodeoxyribonuclease RuvC
LGLDPGLAVTGYAVLRGNRRQPKLVEAGILRASRSKALDARLAELFQGLIEVLDAHPIQAVSIEQLYSHYDRPRTAILMGHARGVYCLAAAQREIPVFSYAATKVKRMLTGAGRAPKDQMQRAVQLQLKLPKVPEPPDVADAIAIALCHMFSHHGLDEK